MGVLDWFSDTSRAPSARGSDPDEVPRDTTPIWVLRGWKRSDRTYTGPYATKYGTWHGSIRATPDNMSVLIYNPPDVLCRHPAWHCFHPRSDKWWAVHLAQPPINGDVNAVILYVERLIVESYRIAGKR